MGTYHYGTLTTPDNIVGIALGISIAIIVTLTILLITKYGGEKI